MSSNWAEEAEAAVFENPRHERKAYVPPHLRNQPSSTSPVVPTSSSLPAGGWGSVDARAGWGSQSGTHGRGRGNSWGGTPAGGGRPGRGGWGLREDDPFLEAANKDKGANELFSGENSGINFDAYEDIPVETSGDNVPDPISSFSDVEMHPALLANVERCKYTKPTPVQRYSIPIGLAGRDMMACAQTGSGKTAAFCFPIILGILRSGSQLTSRGRKAFPLALVLSPTRELSSQIFDEARKFCYQSGIRSVVVYGGAPVGNQVKMFKWYI